MSEPNEIYAYPIIIQTWQKGQGAIMLSGMYDDTIVLKWAKEQVLNWNNSYSPKENQITIQQDSLGHHRLWGIIQCGGVEDFGRPFLEIRAILLDQRAVVPSDQDLQSRLLALDLKQHLDVKDLHLPLARSPIPPPTVEPAMIQKIQDYTQHVLPQVKKQWQTNRSRLGHGLVYIGHGLVRFVKWLYPHLKHFVQMAWADVEYVWKNRRDLWTSFKKRVQELRQHPEQIRPWLQNTVWVFACLHKKKIGAWALGILVVISLMILVWPSSPTPVNIQNPIPTTQPTENLTPDEAIQYAISIGTKQENPPNNNQGNQPNNTQGNQPNNTQGKPPNNTQGNQPTENHPNSNPPETQVPAPNTSNPPTVPSNTANSPQPNTNNTIPPK